MARHVLLIDDYAHSLESLHELMGTWGYEVECTANGRDGLAALSARAPDIVVVDLLLPDMDGCDLIRRIRESTAHGVLIVAYSGYPRSRFAALEAGADCFVLKPDLDGLRAAFQRTDAAATPRARKPNPGG